MEHTGPIKVTISDPESGMVLEEKILRDDYAVITAGNRFVKHMQIMGKCHTYYISRDDSPKPITKETTHE